MSNYKQTGAQVSSEPRRPLQADFTAQTMKRAHVAKARRARKKQLQAIGKGFFSMKSIKFLRTVPGAALALAMAATGSVGAYALSNWFNGEVTVRQNDSVLSVDLSSCKGDFPPGVDSTDRSNVQFKIVGNPHISADELQQQLLAECEFNAVLDFYKSNQATKDFYLPAGTIKHVNDGNVTITYLWGGEIQEKTYKFAESGSVYNEGAPAALKDLQVGDSVVFALELAAQPQEGIDPFAQVGTVQSIFKTKYDTNQAPGTSKKGFYEGANIMPLDHYNKIQH